MTVLAIRAVGHRARRVRCGGRASGCAPDPAPSDEARPDVFRFPPP